MLYRDDLHKQVHRTLNTKNSVLETLERVWKMAHAEKSSFANGSDATSPCSRS